jgi:hypothetical protein
MKAELLNLIATIESRKRAEKIEPSHVTLLELHQFINNQLNELWKDGKIEVGKTINSKWIKII